MPGYAARISIQAGKPITGTKEIAPAGIGQRTNPQKVQVVSGEAAMTIAMTENLDLELAEMREAAIANSSKVDPIPMIEQLPEVSVPVASLVPGFHLRHEGTDAAHVRLLADAAGSVKLPAILVQKSGSRIIDGMHRQPAREQAGSAS